MMHAFSGPQAHAIVFVEVFHGDIEEAVHAALGNKLSDPEHQEYWEEVANQIARSRA